MSNPMHSSSDSSFATPPPPPPRTRLLRVQKNASHRSFGSLFHAPISSPSQSVPSKYRPIAATSPLPPPKKSRIKPRYTGERSGSVQQRFIQNAADNPLDSINAMDGVTLDKTLSVLLRI